MNMNSIFKELFKPIHAKEELKNQTIAFLAERTQGYKRQAVQKMTMREIRDLIDCLSTDKENNSSSYNNRQNGHHRHGGDGQRWRNGNHSQETSCDYILSSMTSWLRTNVQLVTG